jgi:TonB family protein
MPRLAILAALAVLLTACALAQNQASAQDHIDPATVLRVCKATNPPPCATSPKIVRQADPEYSQDARKHRIQGTVVMSLVVGTDGRAHDIRVTQSIGRGLDEEAIKAVKKWRFQPGTNNGVAVPVQIEVEINFHIYD